MKTKPKRGLKPSPAQRITQKVTDYRAANEQLKSQTLTPEARRAFQAMADSALSAIHTLAEIYPDNAAWTKTKWTE